MGAGECRLVITRWAFRQMPCYLFRAHSHVVFIRRDGANFAAEKVPTQVARTYVRGQRVGAGVELNLSDAGKTCTHSVEAVEV